MTTQAPAISVIVLSHQAPASLPDAVRSLQAQGTACEIVVVNSGGGGPQRLLQLAGVDCRIIESRERLNPGAARNIGIRETSGDIVAFLADDCRVTGTWIATRIARHAAGHRVVASALIPDQPGLLANLASHVMLFGRRMPGCPVADAQRYGASYHRSVFEQYGLFRDDLRTGEDTDFHARLATDDKPVWAPDIITIHRGPTTLGALFSDQATRGARTAAAWPQISGASSKQVLRNTWERIRRTRDLLPRVLPAGSNRFAITALVIAGNVAYAWGALRQSRVAATRRQ
jgi:glycosyltransferase involved in cell wall biosynthesis